VNGKIIMSAEATASRRSIVHLMARLRDDAQLQSTLSTEKWQQLDELYAKYEVSAFFHVTLMPASFLIYARALSKRSAHN
jgi:hypothetical protein